MGVRVDVEPDERYGHWYDRCDDTFLATIEIPDDLEAELRAAEAAHRKALRKVRDYIAANHGKIRAAVPEEPVEIFVIASTFEGQWGGTMFWSSAHGWDYSLDIADRFTTQQRAGMTLPDGGAWRDWAKAVEAQ